MVKQLGKFTFTVSVRGEVGDLGECELDVWLEASAKTKEQAALRLAEIAVDLQDMILLEAQVHVEEFMSGPYLKDIVVKRISKARGMTGS